MALPPLSGLTGDLQTVVTALQAVTVKIGDLIAALSKPHRYFHLAGATSGLINTGSTTLYGVALNSASGGTGSTVTLYDGTSNAAPVIGALNVSSANGINYGVGGLHLSNGLFAQTAGSATDVTVIWDTP